MFACILTIHTVFLWSDSPVSALRKRRSHPLGRTTGLIGFPSFPLLSSPLRTLWTSEDMLRIVRNQLLLGIKPVFNLKLRWFNLKFQLQQHHFLASSDKEGLNKYLHRQVFFSEQTYISIFRNADETKARVTETADKKVKVLSPTFVFKSPKFRPCSEYPSIQPERESLNE